MRVEPSERRYHPLVELTRVRLLEFVREREAVFWVFVFPVLLALALGIAFRSSGNPTSRITVSGSDPWRSTVVGALRQARGISLVDRAAADPDRALTRGTVDVVVEAGAPSAPGLPFSVTYRWDPAKAAGVAGRLAVDDALQRAAGRRSPLTPDDHPLATPGQRYIDFLIPGLVGLNLMGSGLWGLGFSIVVARTRKLLKRFAASGMRRSHFLASYALSRLVFLALEVAAIVGFGRWAFDVEVQGSFVALAVVAVAGSLTFAAIGLLVAARPATIESVSGWMNLVMLPMWLLSGSFFSYERFPEVTWPAIRALPLTAVNDALRAVMLDGAPLHSTWPQLAVLAAWGVGAFLLAVRIFRWR